VASWKGRCKRACNAIALTKKKTLKQKLLGIFNGTITPSKFTSKQIENKWTSKSEQIGHNWTINLQQKAQDATKKTKRRDGENHAFIVEFFKNILILFQEVVSMSISKVLNCFHLVNSYRNSHAFFLHNPSM
jgi:hypothetical protein